VWGVGLVGLIAGIGVRGEVLVVLCRSVGGGGVGLVSVVRKVGLVGWVSCAVGWGGALIRGLYRQVELDWWRLVWGWCDPRVQGVVGLEEGLEGWGDSSVISSGWWRSRVLGLVGGRGGGWAGAD